MESIQAIFDVLNSSTCSESYHRFSPIPGYPVITDGVFMLAEAAGCSCKTAKRRSLLCGTENQPNY